MSCRKGSIANIALTTSLVKAANGDKQLADFLIKQSNIYQTSKQADGILNALDGGEAADKLFAVSVNYGIKNPVYVKQFMDNVADSITVRDKTVAEQYEFFDSITGKIDKEYLAGKGIDADEVKKTLENFAFTMYKRAEDSNQVLKSSFGARGAELLANNIEEGDVSSYIKEFLNKADDKPQAARKIVKDIFATGMSDEYIELLYMSKGREDNLADNLSDLIYYTHIKGGPSYAVAKSIMGYIQHKENLPDLSTEEKYVQFLIESGKMNLDKSGRELSFQNVFDALKQAREVDKYIYSADGILIKEQAIVSKFKAFGTADELRRKILAGETILEKKGKNFTAISNDEKASLFGISIAKAEYDGRGIPGIDVFSDYIKYTQDNTIPLNQTTYNKFRQDKGKDIIEREIGDRKETLSSRLLSDLVIYTSGKQSGNKVKDLSTKEVYVLEPEAPLTADQKLIEEYIDQNAVVTNIKATYVKKEELTGKGEGVVVIGDGKVGMKSGFQARVENGKLVVSSSSKRRMNDYLGALFTPKEGEVALGEDSLYRANIALQERVLGQIDERDNLYDVQKRIDIYNEVTGLAPLKQQEDMPELKVGQSMDGIETILREYLMADTLLPSGKTLQAGEQERVTEALRAFIYKGETDELASYFNITSTDGTILDKWRIAEELKKKVSGTERGLRPIVNILVNNQGVLNKLLVDIKAGKITSQQAQGILVNLSSNQQKIDMVRFISDTYIGAKKLREGEFDKKFLPGLEQFLDDASSIMSNAPKYQATKFPEGYFHSGMLNELKGGNVGAVVFDDLLEYSGESITRRDELIKQYDRIEGELTKITTDFYKELGKLKDGPARQKLADEYRNKIMNFQLENRNWNVFPEFGSASSKLPSITNLPGKYLIEISNDGKKTALKSISDFYTQAKNGVKQFEYERATMFDRLAKNGYTDITLRDRRARVTIDDALKYYGYTGTQYMSFETKSKILQKEIDDANVFIPKTRVDAFIKELPHLDGIQTVNLGSNIVLPKMIGNPSNLDDAIAIHNQIIEAFETGQDMNKVDLDVLDDDLKKKFTEYKRKLEIVNANPKLRNVMLGGEEYPTVGKGLDNNDILTRTNVEGTKVVPMDKSAEDIIEKIDKEFNDFTSCV